MRSGSGEIIVYSHTGGSSVKREYKTISLDDPLVILGFSGSAPITTSSIRYTITPPFATGSFALDGGTSSYLSGLIMRI
jgi:hypothetical protein